jgi:hypothetical protein
LTNLATIPIISPVNTKASFESLPFMKKIAMKKMKKK